MEEVFRMYAMSDGDPKGEPEELDPDFEGDFDDDDEDEESSSVLTSSDDDEGVVEEALIIIIEEPAAKPAAKFGQSWRPAGYEASIGESAAIIGSAGESAVRE